MAVNKTIAVYFVNPTRHGPTAAKKTIDSGLVFVLGIRRTAIQSPRSVAGRSFKVV